MSNEQETFDRLRRIPFEDMVKLYDDVITGLSPTITLGHSPANYGGMAHSPYDLRPKELILHYARMNVLAAHGWTFDAFVTEVERNAILKEVDYFNKNTTFPPELLKRAKQFFPNARFTEAKIELE